MKKYDNIVLDITDGIGVLTIDRPKSLNALNEETLLEMSDCLSDLAADPAVSVVIITGGGEKSFVAGADISFMQSLKVAEAKKFGQLGHQVARAIEELPQPVIGAINGFALGGGCELAISCDLRFASSNAKFGQPEVNLGVIPGFGGTQRLPRLVGKGLACELIFSGKIIDAEEALRIGLVNQVFAQDELMDECMKLARQISSRGPRAVKMCKEAVNNGLEMDLRRACSYEADLFALCFGNEEQREGMQAFLEKRAPEFSK